MSNHSISVTLTIFHDGQFWVGILERIEGESLCAARIVFGAEPSNEEVLQFIQNRWNRFRFSPTVQLERKKTASNPKRRQREAAKEAAKAQPSTKAQIALAEMREEGKQASRKRNSAVKKAEADARFRLKTEKRKQKHRGR
ncbi:MAG: YjdF family protein [Eggerthellaceae bacterium]